MKKAFVLGMAFVTVISTQSFAAPAKFAEYAKVTKDYYLAPSGDFKPGARDVFASKLNLTGNKAALLDTVKDSSKRETLVEFAAIKEIAISKGDKQKQSAADSSAALLLRSAMKSDLKGRSADDAMVISQGAITHVETNLKDILNEYGPQTAKGFQDIIVKFDEIVSKQSLGSYEEKFLQAIQESRGVSREKAIEIAKQMKDCV